MDAIRRWSRAAAAGATLALAACVVKTLPLHAPLYPSSSDRVTFSLDTSAERGVATVRLYELVSSIDADGTVTPGAEVLLEAWSPAGAPTAVTLAHTRAGAYAAGSLVRYRFEVTTASGRTRSHDVTFATRPYPVPRRPAPVYVQGDVDHVFDVVFIPDTDITDLPAFYDHCRAMIVDGVFAEPSVRPWSRQFNFYVNPETGHAADYDADEDHEMPANWPELSFAEVKLIMHAGTLRDWANGWVFSTEQQNRGTMMHESGHLLFRLADEYPAGVHRQEERFPNNWSTLAGAQADAPSRHKAAGDATEMGSSGWYKICSESCQMRSGSELARSDYDAPCGDRVFYSVFEAALR